MILRSKKESTRFQILVEIAAHQPDVRQKEIADKIGITPQAVSEYIKDLVSDGLLFSDCRVRYRVTKKGVEWVLERAMDVKKFEEMHLVPTLFFIDPWGYKGLSLRLIPIAADSAVTVTDSVSCPISST